MNRAVENIVKSLSATKKIQRRQNDKPLHEYAALDFAKIIQNDKEKQEKLKKKKLTSRNAENEKAARHERMANVWLKLNQLGGLGLQN